MNAAPPIPLYAAILGLKYVETIPAIIPHAKRYATRVFGYGSYLSFCVIQYIYMSGVAKLAMVKLMFLIQVFP